MVKQQYYTSSIGKLMDKVMATVLEFIPHGYTLIKTHFSTRAVQTVSIDSTTLQRWQAVSLQTIKQKKVALAEAHTPDLHIDVQKASLHDLEREAHLHAGADAVEEALLCVGVHTREVAAGDPAQPR